MRRTQVLVMALLATFAAGVAVAQQQRQDPDEQRREDNRRQRQVDQEFQREDLPLPELANSGPCPYVKVLYDAARDVRFASNQVSAANVTWSSEIDGLSATCKYGKDEPIKVELIVTFAVGKGPQAQGNSTDLHYWVAVTHRNAAVLAKEEFTVPVTVPAGQDRTLAFQHIKEITIPRADDKVSGENFEVLVGFDVTPEQAEFNRKGSRFLVNTTGQAQSSESASNQ